MRLTLRTLLAYLDDLLEPEQAKELGRKIAENDFASSLSNRVRDVMRRRRLTAPDIDGPATGIDPNTIAEYLDNTLTPDLVADLEKICLESDTHLAEVAACHQILTLVLGEPIEISSASRDRMYALAPPLQTATATKNESSPNTTSHNHTERPQHQPVVSELKQPPSAAQIIDDAHTNHRPKKDNPHLQRPSLSRRSLPYLGLLLILLIFGGLIVSDPKLFPELLPSNDSSVTKIDKKNPAKNQLAHNNPQKTRKIFRPKPIHNFPKVPLPSPIRKDPPPKIPIQPIHQPPIKIPQPPKPKTPPLTVVEKIPLIRYLAIKRGRLFRNTPFNNTHKWLAIPAETILKANDKIVSPAPFESILEIGDGLFGIPQGRLAITAGTAIQLLPASPAGPFGIQLQQGRIVIQRKISFKATPKTDKSQPKKQNIFVFGLKIRNELWRIELQSEDTVCGIEMQPRAANGIDADWGINTYNGGLYVINGSLRIINPKGDSLTIQSEKEACGYLSLLPSNHRKSGQKTFPKFSQISKPFWLTSAGRRLTPQIEQFANRYQIIFKAEKDADGNDIIALKKNAVTLAKDRNPIIAQFAAQGLAITQNYKELVQIIATTKHEEPRDAAINGLRQWLPIEKENNQRLLQELKKQFPSDDEKFYDAKAVHQLLWGVAATQMRHPEISKLLVEWLDHPHVTIRKLTFSHIQRLTKKQNGYGVFLSTGHRKMAVERWRNYVKKQGALLPPEQPKEKLEIP